MATHQLHIACAEGRIEAVTSLLNAGVDTELRKPHGATPLWIAAEKGNFQVVKLLLEADAQINATDNDGVTPLYIASQNGHTEIVKELVSRGADLEIAKVSEATPLFIAAQEGHPEVLRILWFAGADVDKAMLKGISPFMAACFEGHTKAAAFLCLVGCDIYQTAKRRTGLQWALSEGHAEVLGAVLEAKNSRMILRTYFSILQKWVEKLAVGRPQSKAKNTQQTQDDAKAKNEPEQDELDSLKGYLWKRGGTLNRWKRRFFVVTKGAYSFTIDYYAKEDEAALGSILTRNIDRVGPYRFEKKDRPPNPNFINCGFYIRASEPKDKIYVLCAPSPEQKMRWLQMLVRACQTLKRQPTLVSLQQKQKQQQEEEEESSNSGESELLSD